MLSYMPTITSTDDKGRLKLDSAWAYSSTGLSVCLAVMFVHCAQTAEDIDRISFAQDSHLSSHRAKIWLTSANPFLSKFCPKVTIPSVYLIVGEIRSQIAAEWLRITQWSQLRDYRKRPSLFRIVPTLTPYDLPSPKWGFLCIWAMSLFANLLSSFLL